MLNLARTCIPESLEFMAVGIDSAAPIPCKYGATYHKADIKELKKRCELVIHHQPLDGVDLVEPIQGDPLARTGSSAHLAVLAGRRLGYQKIVLCGCPMEGAHPVYEDANYDMFHQKWIDQKEDLAPYLRSMSGFTRSLYGSPTWSWLNE